jgi:hypothetical protein
MFWRIVCACTTCTTCTGCYVNASPLLLQLVENILELQQRLDFEIESKGEVSLSTV